MSETKKEELTQEERIEALSQDIFGKPSKDIKYLLVTHFIHKQLLDEELARTGLYQWLNVFRGDVKNAREVIDYSEYDIVQVNMSAQDLHLVGKIRDQIGEDSKTLLILNNDYTTEMWGRAFDYPSNMRREMINADMIFGTEYYQTTAVAELSGRKVFIIPHPADVKRLKHLTPIPKKDIISTIWRRYDNHAWIPHLVARNQGLTTQLLGYDQNSDQKTFTTTTLYDYIFRGTNYFDFCDQMRESKIVYDPFTFHSYSRATVDTAAMGVAVVGSNRTQSMQVCYPHTIVDPFDVTSARRLIRKLLDDKEFYKKVVETVKTNVEWYNHQNSKERYLESLKQALEEDRDVKQEFREKSTDKGVGDDILEVISNGNTQEKPNESKKKQIQTK